MGGIKQRTLVQCSAPTHLTLTSHEPGLLVLSSQVGTLRLSEVKELLKVRLLASGRAGIEAQGPGAVEEGEGHTVESVTESKPLALSGLTSELSNQGASLRPRKLDVKGRLVKPQLCGPQLLLPPPPRGRQPEQDESRWVWLVLIKCHLHKQAAAGPCLPMPGLDRWSANCGSRAEVCCSVDS